MSKNTAKALATPRTVELAGEKFEMSPLRFEEHGKFEAWMQKKTMDAAKVAIQGLPDSQAQPILNRAADQCALLLFGSQESMKLMFSFEGMCQLMFLSLNQRQPDITIEKIVELMGDDRTVEMLWNEFDRLNELGETKKASPKLAKRAGQWRAKKPRNE